MVVNNKEVKGCHDEEAIIALLPAVGTHLKKRPAWSNQQVRAPLTPCVVEYVNKRHHWYTVRYLVGSGFRESFKVPEVKGDAKWKR